MIDAIASGGFAARKTNYREGINQRCDVQDSLFSLTGNHRWSEGLTPLHGEYRIHSYGIYVIRSTPFLSSIDLAILRLRHGKYFLVASCPDLVYSNGIAPSPHRHTSAESKTSLVLPGVALHALAAGAGVHHRLFRLGIEPFVALLGAHLRTANPSHILPPNELTSAKVHPTP